mmetsp:Transcript_13614/g.16536  ORF Transcript_13614/g.16536 Transcript_13614/m.16536 type:complete len:216 (-) Transcript_13614:379-1026(-)
MVKAARGQSGVLVTQILVFGAITDVSAPRVNNLANTFRRPKSPSKRYNVISALFKSTGPVNSSKSSPIWLMASRSDLMGDFICLPYCFCFSSLAFSPYCLILTLHEAWELLPFSIISCNFLEAIAFFASSGYVSPSATMSNRDLINEHRLTVLIRSSSDSTLGSEIYCIAFSYACLSHSSISSAMVKFEDSAGEKPMVSSFSSSNLEARAEVNSK